MTPATPPADLLDRYFAPAVEATLESLRAGGGGPFGATLADPTGRIVVAVGNTVLRRHLDGSDTSALDMIHLTSGREDCAGIWTEFQRRKA
ncbi:hypothetical protein ACIPY5_04815 [Microbacterium sp. NPDC089698]|uniref:hypothetical protein n=1 Tax=Microbacterium sp. NPDC089698 TaxID=3364200 RepID=UPI00381DFFB9